VTGPITDHHIA